MTRRLGVVVDNTPVFSQILSIGQSAKIQVGYPETHDVELKIGSWWKVHIWVDGVKKARPASTLSNFQGNPANVDNMRITKALDSSNEVKITVVGRKTRREYSTPVWFVRDGRTTYLLPGVGSRSNWYRNALTFSRIKISFGPVSLDLAAKSVTDSSKISSIVDKFRKKYGATYYSDPKRFDAALDLTLP